LKDIEEFQQTGGWVRVGKKAKDESIAFSHGWNAAE
jgi:hypothetical protein